MASVIEKLIKRKTIKIIVREENNDNLRERYGGVTGSFVLEGELMMPNTESQRKDLVGIFMHPTAATTMLPLPLALTNIGMHICVASSRYPNNDSLLYAENLILDLYQFIHHLKKKLHYKKIILFGWSGGGALAALYQSQAENPTITKTPTGRSIDLNHLIPADYLVLVAAHCGRASYLTEALDPSIYLHQRNSNDPKELQALQIYGKNSTQPPYSNEFLNRYREAQRERSKRITEWAKSVHPETPFILHGTMADPRWLDLTIDKNDRPKAGYCFLGECEAANDMPTGLARFSTAGSWLSQWAEGVSELDALKHLPNTNIPTLVISNGGDDGVPSSHGPAMFNSILHSKKQFEIIEKATHYYIYGNPPRLQKSQLFQCVQIICKFIDNYSSIPLDILQNEYSSKNWNPLEFKKNVVEKKKNVMANKNINRPKATGFNHIAMVCSDMAETVRFYSGVLGFPLVKTLELPGNGQHFFFDCGDPNGGLLAFFWWPEMVEKLAPGIATASKADMLAGKLPKSYPGSLNHIAFDYPEDDLDELRDNLIAAGVWVSPKVFHANNEIGFAASRDDPDVIFVSIYLWGPDGELIEFSTSTEAMFNSKLESRIVHEPKFKQLSKM